LKANLSKYWELFQTPLSSLNSQDTTSNPSILLFHNRKRLELVIDFQSRTQFFVLLETDSRRISIKQFRKRTALEARFVNAL